MTRRRLKYYPGSHGHTRRRLLRLMGLVPLSMSLVFGGAMFFGRITLWTAGVAVAVVFLLYIPLLLLAHRLDRQTQRVLRENDYAICLKCDYPLTLDRSEGSCPECSEPYVLDEVQHRWRGGGL